MPSRTVRSATCLAILAACAAAPLTARAEGRSFIRAYEYGTTEKGELEVALWNDVATPRAGGLPQAVLTHRLELEYGITDHLDVALYHVFEQGGDAGAFHLDSWRLESRYRFAEPGRWPVDVMVYLELERPADMSMPFELEERLIGEKDLGRFGLVVNLAAEQHLLRGDLGHTLEIDLGARYALLPVLRLGVEAWGRADVVGTATTWQTFVGPSIGVTTEKFWLQTGAGFGLFAGEQSLLFRAVIGTEL